MRRFPHSTVHTFSIQHPSKNFCRGSPQKQVSTRSKIHSLREKTLQHAVTSFRRHTTYKNCRIVKFRTHQLTTRGRSTQQTIRENLSQTTRPAVIQSQTLTNQHLKQLAQVFSTTSMSARNHCQHHIQSKNLPVRSVPNVHTASYWRDQAGRSPQARR